MYMGVGLDVYAGWCRCICGWVDLGRSLVKNNNKKKENTQIRPNRLGKSKFRFM